MVTYLEFEKPVAALEARITELRAAAGDDGAVDITRELANLEKKSAEQLAQIYAGLTPWQKTQVARHPMRPHFCDYVAHMFSDFLPLGGDRLYGDDEAIMGGLATLDGRRVVLMPCGNVGHAPFFLPPLTWWMDARSKEMHAIAQSVASNGGARYIRLLQPKESDPFVQRSKEMNAADGLHPSSTGYQHWYTELVRQGGLEGFAH